MAQHLATIYIHLYTALFFAVWFLGLLPIWLVGLAVDPHRRAVHWYLGVWCRVYIALNPFWRLRVRGREHLPQGPCVMVANHQSMLDIVVLLALRVPFKWVAKRELFRVPFFGWLLRMGRYVGIDRGRRADASRMFDICQGHLRRGLPLMIFPEGSRSADGRVHPFKHGAFTIALQGGVPVIPMAVCGPSETLSGLRFSPRRVTMRVHILPPLRVPSQEELRDTLQRAHEMVRGEHMRMAPSWYQ